MAAIHRSVGQPCSRQTRSFSNLHDFTNFLLRVTATATLLITVVLRVHLQELNVPMQKFCQKRGDWR